MVEQILLQCPPSAVYRFQTVCILWKQVTIESPPLRRLMLRAPDHESDPASPVFNPLLNIINRDDAAEPGHVVYTATLKGQNIRPADLFRLFDGRQNKSPLWHDTYIAQPPPSMAAIVSGSGDSFCVGDELVTMRDVVQVACQSGLDPARSHPAAVGSMVVDRWAEDGLSKSSKIVNLGTRPLDERYPGEPVLLKMCFRN